MQHSKVKVVSMFTLVCCLAHSSNLEMEATCSSETSADFQRATRCYFPENRSIVVVCLNVVMLLHNLQLQSARDNKLVRGYSKMEKPRSLKGI
jgi:hypothetical protein